MSPDDRSTRARGSSSVKGRPPVDEFQDEGTADPAGAEEAAAADAGGAPSAAPGTEADPAALRDRWLRAEADLQNYRRRAQRDIEESVRFAEDRVLLESIGHLDDLERALALANEAGAPDPWVQGVRLVANRIRDDLARHGVTPMKPLGHAFDPEQHEALLEVDATEDAPPGHVVQVVREGYRRNDRALRAARVVVARRSEGA